MPVHRVNTVGDPADALEAAVKRLEKNGETIVQVLPWANGWLIATHAPVRRIGHAKPRPIETRKRAA